ncbi:right-handed parallel beta-helix repeat-containing protein [bacterium]|nr:right-handed parallel beta-helix repeat-containing protein [candidate division CSSED10-310 bacterium]
MPLIRNSALIIPLMLCLTVSAEAAVYYVPGDYPTILDAYRGVEPDDTVIVRPGIYHGDGWNCVPMIGKSVNFIAENGPAQTIIDGKGITPGFLFKDIPGHDMLVDGFTFKDCTGTLTGAVTFFETSAVTLHNCVIIRGRATSTEDPGEGGGIRIWKASPVIVDCIIQDCSAIQGGGVCILDESYPIFKRCVISGCWGSGFFCFTGDQPLIEDCHIIDCESSEVSWAGGLGFYGSSDADIQNCLIADNRNPHTSGGGIRIEKSHPRFTNCMIVDNWTVEHGGALLCRVDAFPEFTHCTLAGNTAEGNGAGIASMIESDPVFKACILWNPAGTELYSENQGSATITYSDIRMDYPGEGNFQADPRFAAPGDYHLSADSPCIGRSIYFDVDRDYDGESRLESQRFDVGADQYYDPEEFGVRLEMPYHEYRPGNSCSLDVICLNSGPSREGLLLFVVLSAYGENYFWPAWNAFDFLDIELSSSETVVPVIPEFPWPAGAGSGENVFFYSGLTNPVKTELLGDIDSWEMSWHP